MKKLIYLTINVLLAFSLGACAAATPIASATPVASATPLASATPESPATPTASEEMINPGDKIGDFLITTGASEDITYVTKVHCPYDESAGIESCEIKVGTKVNVGLGIFDSTHSGKLDSLWADQTYAMVIEGRPVNLQAFGAIDFSNPIVGIVRVWNVVIVTDQPGKIKARSTGIVGGDPFDYTAILTFSLP